MKMLNYETQLYLIDIKIRKRLMVLCNGFKKDLEQLRGHLYQKDFKQYHSLLPELVSQAFDDVSVANPDLQYLDEDVLIEHERTLNHDLTSEGFHVF